MQLAVDTEFEEVEENRARAAWWLLDHSNDPHRRTAVLTCYLDESGTDNESTIAVVAGVILDMRQFFWIDQAWRKCLAVHNIPWPLHMKEFGNHGSLSHIRSEARRALFSDVVRIINDNKTFSVAATMNSEQYRKVFGGLTGFSMYGAAFLQMAMMNGTGAQLGGYTKPIAYLLDTGNPFKHEVLEAYNFLVEARALNVGALAFDSDDNLSALQVADVVSWSVRRKLASKLKSGFEPLADLDDETHVEILYEESWMVQVANSLRAKLKP